MQILINRLHFRADGVFSTLTGPGLALVCLEHAYPDVNKWAPKVPAGAYKATRYMSPKLGYEVFCLQDVPGCEFIELHCGNYNEDSEGCFCIGKTIDLYRSPAMVTQSRDAFLELMDACNGLSEIDVVVS